MRKKKSPPAQAKPQPASPAPELPLASAAALTQKSAQPQLPVWWWWQQ